MATGLFFKSIPHRVASVPFFIIPYSDQDMNGSILRMSLNAVMVMTGSIISKSVPESIKDSKKINMGSTQIPGGHTSIPKFGSFDARKISFSFKLIEKNQVRGLSNQLKALDVLRYPNMAGGNMLGVVSDPKYGLFKPFTPPPKVLYMYGVGTLLLSYYVESCDIELTKMNKYGFPQVADINMSLIMEETNKLFQVEQGYRLFAQLFNGLRNNKSLQSIRSKRYTGNPYVTFGIGGDKGQKFFGNFGKNL